MKNSFSIIEKIEKLISKLPEVYQSIYLNGDLIREGVRKNDWERLEVIKQYIKPHQTILDIGSNVGFFTINLAKIFPENVFLSIESNQSYANLQRELLKQEKIKNVILINSKITVNWLKQAVLACTYFDVTLLLSVLHHMDDAIQFLEELSKISKSLVIEMPDPNESRVCGKHILKNQLTLDKISQVKPVFKKLDHESKSHCDSNLNRAFYYGDSPKYERESIFPYIGYALQPRHYLLKSQNDKQVQLHKSHLNQDITLIPGILLSDVAKIGNIFFPFQEKFKTQIEKEFEFLDTVENAADIRPWNLLFTANGLKFIDYKYTEDLAKNLHYDKEKDFSIVCNYLKDIFEVYPKPTVLIDGVFFQLYNTGIARVWYSLLEEWSKNGFAKHLIVLDRVNTAPKIPGIRYLSVPAYDYSTTDTDREMLQQVCDQEAADLFVSTYYTTPLSTPSVFMAYDMIPEVMAWALNHPMWREKHQGIQYASAYIAISENTAQDLVKFFPNISPESVTVAPCAVSSSFLPASVAEMNLFRTKYGISKPYFILVGLGGGYKNTILFFQAFAQLYSRQGFDIVCTGSGAFLSEEFRTYSLGSTVHMLQLSDEELKTAYSGAVALVYPSLYEGFGLPILEAMACGCPVITCPNASIPKVAGEAALYLADNDVKGMANALCEVQKPDIRNTLIAAGLEQVKKFSWSKMASTVSSVLIEATLLPLNLKDINLIIFPDWSQAEEPLCLELERVIKAIATHPDKSYMTLLINSSGISEEEANLYLSAVAMNLLMEEDLDVSEGPEIALVGDLGEIQWEVLLPRLHARIVLEKDNQEAIAQARADTLLSYELESFSNRETGSFFLN
ncbi:MAG: glycosyltransferase [Symploca sp. SIO2G7]|nr:glycosyltransferase [Symploca sp. SIO2G7]